MPRVAIRGFAANRSRKSFWNDLETTLCVNRNLLCGDRRKIDGGWPTRLRGTGKRLLKVLPIAEELGLTIAIENHQDATADDLLKLWDLVGQSPAFGITLDTGNPLAVGEDPVEMCRRIAPLIRHVHL